MVGEVSVARFDEFLYGLTEFRLDEPLDLAASLQRRRPRPPQLRPPGIVKVERHGGAKRHHCRRRYGAAHDLGLCRGAGVWHEHSQQLAQVRHDLPLKVEQLNLGPPETIDELVCELAPHRLRVEGPGPQRRATQQFVGERIALLQRAGVDLVEQTTAQRRKLGGDDVYLPLIEQRRGPVDDG